ncbi:helix-turn-helix domain-containing protein [Actinomadura rugatobispora]|uniref:Scr1 family TA system antitoxin-like transcriptional regulator n=1 Tax=Actinomadura rugatobispora TaxID=1994 RepID=A0ABW1AIX2_9ACTN|nr:helix-turn-helix transcriptional regulator [Actinomadura rugatobispora]
MASNHLTPRMFLAKELQRAREQRGMKTDDVAKAIYVSEGLVRSWERGRRVPQPDHLVLLEELFGPETFAGILRRMREELINSAVPLEWMGRWREVEEKSRALLSLETTVVPGLLQTEDYATAVCRMAPHLGDVEKMVSERMERQRILAREDDDGPTLVALLTETVLVSKVGDAQVMHNQLAHLVEMARRDDIIVQVVPFDSGVGAGFIAPFVIATFDGGEVAYVDDQLGAEVVEEPENVAVLRRMFERFRAEALSRPDSIELIERTMEERWTGE